MADFTEKIGPVFDLMFKYVADPPPTPVAKNAKAFLDYSGAKIVRGSGSTVRIRVWQCRTSGLCSQTRK